MSPLLRASLFLILFLSPLAQAKETALCPTIIFKDKPPFKLSADESRLICGDKDADSKSKAWASIPPWQAQMSLRAMLQIRGYHKAVYQTQETILYVDLGAPTIISQIYLHGAPPLLDINRKREIKGEKLTPAKLNELQNWIVLELKHIGYPCPKVDSSADYETGEISVTIQAGDHLKIAKIGSDQIGDLHQGVIRRYDAFHLGEDYDVWNVTMTEKRVVEDDLVLGDHISTTCTPEGAVLYQTIQPGLPRLLQIGVGLDTEQGPQFRTSLHYSRLNQRGSSIDNSLTASFRIQDFKSTFNWYILRQPSRFYLKPTFEVKRDLESDYEYTQTTANFSPSVSWDDEHYRWDLSVGPAFQSVHTVVGVGPTEFQAVQLAENFLLTSHDYEYFKSDPQRGFKISIVSAINNAALDSTVTAGQVTIAGESLLNIGNFSPPVMVAGIRGSVGTITTPNSTSDLASLPPALKYYLGGTQDLRGFARQELPTNSGLGSMTEAYLGAEWRFLALLPWGLQPFLFTDGGLLGSQPTTLDLPLYWSPGLGIRWASPVGSFRTELAHGYMVGPLNGNDPSLSHWQFYLSYGEEF